MLKPLYFSGHCHPTVVKAVQEQAANISHGQVNIFFQKPMLDLIEGLLPKMPSPSLDTFFFWNSGSEAVEAAVKLARHATKKQNIIVFQGSYHGRTFGTMALTTSKTIYGAGFGPLMPGVHCAPYPYFQQWSACKKDPEQFTPEWCGEESLHQLEILLKQRSAPQDTAAILIEPVQGEGGYVVPPKSKLPLHLFYFILTWLNFFIGIFV
jgi:4-aminobutyrate aminotransferase